MGSQYADHAVKELAKASRVAVSRRQTFGVFQVRLSHELWDATSHVMQRLNGLASPRDGRPVTVRGTRLEK